MSFAARAIPLYGSDPYPNASVALDFVRGYFKAPGASGGSLSAIPGWSYSRTGTEYASTSSGLLVPFASGVPAVTDLGLQVWEARTNLLLWSGDLSQNTGGTIWNPNQAGVALSPTVTANNAVAPDGTTTAARIQFSLNSGTASTDRSRLTQSATTTNAATYTASLWLKSNTASSYAMLFRDANGSGGGAITVTPSWQRFVFTFTATTSAAFDLELRGAQTPTNSNTADVAAWGAQLELGSFAGPYCPTTSASATRGAASASVGGLSLSYPLTIVATGVLPSITPTGIQAFLAQLDDGSNTNRSTLQTNNAQQGAVVTASGNVVQANLSLGNLAAGTPYTMALRVASNDVGASSNGSAVTKTATATLPVGPATRLQIGNGAGSSWDGFVRRVTIYPRAFSDAELQAASLTS